MIICVYTFILSLSLSLFLFLSLFLYRDVDWVYVRVAGSQDPNRPLGRFGRHGLSYTNVMFSVFRRVPWHSTFSFSLWICRVFFVSELSLALTIRIFAEDLKCFLCFGICNVFCVSELPMALIIRTFAVDLLCFLCFGALPGTHNSYFR